jgi:threonine dehydratase
LLSGTALAAEYFSPSTIVIGAEPKGADDAFRSFQSKKIEPSQANTIADGLLTSLGDKTLPIILEHVHEIITVDDAAIVAATKLVWERMKILIEPSSAVPLAALLQARDKFKGKPIGIILSGGNVDVEKISELYRYDNPAYNTL